MSRPPPSSPLFPSTPLFRSPAADRLADVQISARVDGHHVQEGELPCHVPGPAEPAEDRLLPEQRRAVVEDPHDLVAAARRCSGDRKSTRLNSSHSQISYAVF